MNTPIADFIDTYKKSGTARLHMPGHKGTGPLGLESSDITEIHGADVLYHAEGIIRESEKNASALFGSGATYYSTEGSSLCIRVMLRLFQIRSCASHPEKRTHVLAFRNVHASFIHACALLDIDVTFVCPKDGSPLLSCLIEKADLEEQILSLEDKPDALFVTSPDYLGNIQDISEMAELCRKYGMLLLCDNAHGAYLRFDGSFRHPLCLGADMCCDSAHKTLPVLTGGAYLHLSAGCAASLESDVERSFRLFASTSPSYLVLKSLDLCNKLLSEDYPQKIQKAEACVKSLKEQLGSLGFELVGNEDLKVTIRATSYGYSGTEIASYLRRCGIECEMADPDYIVFMFAPGNNVTDYKKLADSLSLLPKKAEIRSPAFTFKRGPGAVSLRQALLGNSTELPVKEALGHILSDALISCPPAVPILICGELVTEDDIRKMLYYGIESCHVLSDTDD